jgi:hypothetical protein
MDEHGHGIGDEDGDEMSHHEVDFVDCGNRKRSRS